MNIKLLKEIQSKQISQRDLASKIGMTQSGLSQALASGDLKVSTLEKIAEVLDVPVTCFFEVEITQDKENEEKIARLESEKTQLIKEYAKEVYDNYILEFEEYLKTLENVNKEDIYNEIKSIERFKEKLVTLITFSGNLREGVEKAAIQHFLENHKFRVSYLVNDFLREYENTIKNRRFEIV